MAHYQFYYSKDNFMATILARDAEHGRKLLGLRLDEINEVKKWRDGSGWETTYRRTFIKGENDVPSLD